VIRPAFREALLARPLGILRAIWGFLGFSVLFYVGIGAWLAQTIHPAFSSDIAATITPALYAVAVAIALLAVWWRRFLAPERLLASVDPAATPSLGVGVAPETDAERRALGAMARFQTQSIVAWALSELLAIVGLVLSIGTGDARHVTGLGAATLVLLGTHAPSRARLEAVLAATPGA